MSDLGGYDGESESIESDPDHGARPDEASADRYTSDSDSEDNEETVIVVDDPKSIEDKYRDDDHKDEVESMFGIDADDGEEVEGSGVSANHDGEDREGQSGSENPLEGSIDVAEEGREEEGSEGSTSSEYEDSNGDCWLESLI